MDFPIQTDHFPLPCLCTRQHFKWMVCSLLWCHFLMGPLMGPVPFGGGTSPRFSGWRSHLGMRGVVQIETLLGGLEPWNFMTFHSVGNFIIPSDEVHDFSGRSTTRTTFWWTYARCVELRTHRLGYSARFAVPSFGSVVSHENSYGPARDVWKRLSWLSPWYPLRSLHQHYIIYIFIYLVG